MQEAQEAVRLSSQQATRLSGEVSDYKNRLGTTAQEQDAYKQRIQKLLAENQGLGEEVRSAQENLRLSTGQIGRLTAEFKGMQVSNEDLKKKVEEYTKGHMPEL